MNGPNDVDIELLIIRGIWTELMEAKQRGEPWLEHLKELAKTAVLLYTRHTHVTQAQTQPGAAVTHARPTYAQPGDDVVRVDGTPF